MDTLPPEYLTTKQVAELLGVSTQRIRQIASRLPHKQVGPSGMRLFDPAGVQAFLDEKAAAA